MNQRNVDSWEQIKMIWAQELAVQNERVAELKSQLNEAETERRIFAAFVASTGYGVVRVSREIGVSRPTLNAWRQQGFDNPGEGRRRDAVSRAYNGAAAARGPRQTAEQIASAPLVALRA